MGRVAYFALAAASLAALVFAIWCVPYIPTHDGPNHLAACVLANRLEHPASPLHAYLELGAPLSNLGFQLICETAESIFGWRVAFRITLTIAALLWALGFAYLATAFERRSAVVFFGFATALSWSFYMGMFSWLIAAGLTFFLLGHVLRRPPRRLIDWAVLALALLLIGAVHSFAAALAGLVVAALVLRRDGAPGILLRLAIAGAPAAALSYLGRSIGDSGQTEWHDAGRRAIEAAALFAGGPWWRAVPPVLAALAALVLSKKETRRLAVSGLVLLILYAFAPFHLGGWAYFSTRFLALGFPLAAAAMPPQKSLAAYLIFGAMSLSSLGWSIDHHYRLQPIVEEALAGLEAPIEKRNGPRLPLMLSRAGDDTGMAEVEPLIMILHLYLFDQGGVDPYLYGTLPTVDRVVYKQDPKELFGYFPARFLKNDLACAERGGNCPPLATQYEWHAVFGRNFEDTILFADDEAVFETFERRGYTFDFRRGRLAIVRPRNCKILPAIDGQFPMRIQLGHVPLEQPTVDAHYSPEAGALIMPDCGDLWLSITAPDGTTCAEGNPIRFTVTPEQPVMVPCTLVRPVAP